MVWPRAVAPNVEWAWALAARLDSLTPPGERALSRRWSQMMVAAVIARAGLVDSAEKVLRSARHAAQPDPELDLHEAVARIHLRQPDSVVVLLARYLRANPQLKELVAAHPAFVTL